MLERYDFSMVGCLIFHGWIDFPLFSQFQTSLTITEFPNTIKSYPDSSPARRVIPLFICTPPHTDEKIQEASNCPGNENYSLSLGFWQSFVTIGVHKDHIPALARFCKKQLMGFFVRLLFFVKCKHYH